MSRAFVNEDDQEEAPIIPQRANLPEGVINYVTPYGLEQLKLEREKIETEISDLPRENEKERRRSLIVLQGKIDLLNERIVSARVLHPKEQPQDEVRFGCTVSFRNLSTKTSQKFTIVGVDEADLKQNKISFVAPIAIAITGSKVGEKVEFKLGAEIRMLEILSIEYT